MSSKADRLIQKSKTRVARLSLSISALISETECTPAEVMNVLAQIYEHETAKMLNAQREHYQKDDE